MRIRLPAPVILLAAILAAACAGVPPSARDSGGSLLDPAAARELILSGGGKLLVVDLRTAAEYGAGHLRGAVNVDFWSRSFVDRMDALPRDGSILIYCAHGIRSARARSRLLAMGFTAVAELRGGFSRWPYAEMVER